MIYDLQTLLPELSYNSLDLYPVPGASWQSDCGTSPNVSGRTDTWPWVPSSPESCRTGAAW